MGLSLGTGTPPRWGPGQGLKIRRCDDPLETVQTKVSTFSLLSSSAAGELIYVDLLPGGRLTLMPDAQVDETFYLLSGRVGYESRAGRTVLVPGDSVSTEGLDEAVLLVALEEAKLLYATSAPVFHLLSENLRALRELAVEVELKDGYTADHCDRLQSLAYATARELALPSGRLYLLDHSSYLHDVGKLHVPLPVLNKPGKLTPEEWAVIKKHPTFGREMLARTFMQEAGKIVEQHHERFDGSGYPYGLAGDEITIEAAIIAVADTFDAMTTHRPYARARTEAEAIAELCRYAGVHYPKEVVKAFRASLERAARSLFEA